MNISKSKSHVNLINDVWVKCVVIVIQHWMVKITTLSEPKLTEVSVAIWRLLATTSFTHKTHGCVISSVATDVLAIKHQAINNHSADSAFSSLPKIHIKMLHSL